jgi:hypothetical protein
MNEPSALKRQPRNDRHSAEHAGEVAFDLPTRILQAERAQKADEARIDVAITKAESEIAALEQRHLGPKELQRAIISVRDLAILTTRDVRKNVVKRTTAAKTMQESVDDDFLRRRSRFAEDDLVDASLRTRFFEVLERTPTFELIYHLRDAIEVGNIACAESIRFEFQCREDRREYMASFEMILAKIALHDPVEMRKRLANIRNAAEKVDARITDLLKRAQSSPGIELQRRLAERNDFRLGSNSTDGAESAQQASWNVPVKKSHLG